MPDPVINVENLGKNYRIRHQRSQRYVALRDILTEKVKRLFRSKSSNRQEHTESEDFSALKDVSFEVKQGDVLGIIGRNGAGKSTLLKILSRITDPSAGRVTIRGRVASLLEVGTGFHPELTGRENIHLNGSILGMSSLEIRAKFDEIVAFAEVERFLDTQVKHYSSGMYVRLAFAVAAHLEPEILIVDEVLAVGDAQFQKKCLGKMSEVAHGGRTVLFVSHQMNSIRTLCTRAIMLSAGQIAAEGAVESVVDAYLGQSAELNTLWSFTNEHSLNDPAFMVRRFMLVDKNQNQLSKAITAADRLGVVIEGIVEATNSMLTVGFAIYSDGGELLWWSVQTDTRPDHWPALPIGANRLLCWIPEHLLNEGFYRIDLIVSLHWVKWISQPQVNAPSLRVEVRGNLSESPYWMEKRPGLLAPIIPFQSN